MRIGLVVLSAAAGLALTLGLGGCGGGGGTGSNLPDPTIQFVNASPDSNPLDFTCTGNNDSETSAGVAFIAAATPVTSKQGDHDVTVTDTSTQNELDAVTTSLAKDSKYLGISVGLENYGTENLKRLRLLAFEYNKTPPNGNKANLLVIHAYMRAIGFDTPNIDFQGGDVSTYDPNNPQFSTTNVAFATTPAVLQVDSGVPLIFQARRASTENVLASDASTTFDAGGIYLAIVTGVEGETGTEAPQIKYIKLNP